MKLRNKKTGRTHTLSEDLYIEYTQSGRIAARIVLDGGNMSCYYNSLAELNADWEDYEPKEPLIKDEKIRKAVRVWAEVNELEPDFEMRYSENTFSLISWQACIEFNTQIDGLEHGKKYTITELCGEVEDGD